MSQNSKTAKMVLGRYYRVLNSRLVLGVGWAMWSLMPSFMEICWGFSKLQDPPPTPFPIHRPYTVSALPCCTVISMIHYKKINEYIHSLNNSHLTAT